MGSWIKNQDFWSSGTRPRNLDHHSQITFLGVLSHVQCNPWLTVVLGSWITLLLQYYRDSSRWGLESRIRTFDPQVLNMGSSSSDSCFQIGESKKPKLGSNSWMKMYFIEFTVVWCSLQCTASPPESVPLPLSRGERRWEVLPGCFCSSPWFFLLNAFLPSVQLQGWICFKILKERKNRLTKISVIPELLSGLDTSI